MKLTPRLSNSALLGAFLAVAAASAIHSQNIDAKPKGRVRDTAELNATKLDLELKDASLRDALQALFAKVHVNYVHVLENASRGKITLGVRNVPFEGALVSILRSVESVPLNYVGEGGIVTLSPPRSAGGHANTTNTRVWMDLEKVNFRTVIGTFLRAVHANYSIDQNVQGTVTLKLEGVPFDAAVNRLLKECKPPVQMWSEEGTLFFKSAPGP